MLPQVNVGFYLFFSRGGIARYTHHLLNALSAEENVSVELACDANFDAGGLKSYAVWPGLQSLAHRRPFVRRSRFVAGQIANPRRFTSRADAKRFDIVHFSDFNHVSYPLWRSAIRRDGRKVVATVHDVRRAKSLVHRGYEDAQLKRFYRDADALFVHSASQAEELVEWARVQRARVHVVPYGPFDYGKPIADRATLRECYALPQDRQIALSFGNLRDDKNLDRLIRATASLKSRVHLLVAGRSAAKGHRPIEHYRKLCQDLGCGSSVTFLTKYLSDDEVAEVFTACDWVALPYASTFTSLSGVMCVAARYQRPVLTSATIAFNEAMAGHDIGLSVRPDDDVSLANGISEMTARISGGYAFRFDDYLKFNSWSSAADRTLRVYRQLLSST